MLLHAFFINAPRSARGERKNAVFFKIFIVKRFVCREALFRSNVVKDKIKMKEKVFQEFYLHYYLVTVSSCFLGFLHKYSYNRFGYTGMHAYCPWS